MISRIWVLFTLLVLLAGLAADPALAQSDKGPKGVKAKGLVTSLGGFKETIDMPVVVTGATSSSSRAGRPDASSSGCPPTST